MSKELRNIIFVVLIAILVVGLFLLYRSDSNLYSVQICENLVKGGVLNSKNECRFSNDYYTYMPAIFPLGKTISYVQTGMSGFEIISSGIGSPDLPPYPNCDPEGKREIITYKIIEYGFIRWDVYYTFKFCNGILVYEGVN
jgi:hypothetical protein